jgi:hypothetical protein
MYQYFIIHNDTFLYNCHLSFLCHNDSNLKRIFSTIPTSLCLQMYEHLVQNWYQYHTF